MVNTRTKNNSTVLKRIVEEVVSVTSVAPDVDDFDTSTAFGFLGEDIGGLSYSPYTSEGIENMGMMKSTTAGKHEYLLWLDYLGGPSSSNEEGAECIKVAIDGADDGNPSNLTQTYYFVLVKDKTTLNRRYVFNSITRPFNARNYGSFL